MNHYQIVEQAIYYLTENAQKQPNLDEIAQAVGLSPFHFQRVFQEWAGVSPKKFLQFLNVQHAKTLLEQNQSLLDTTYSVGLSSSGRLHDLFVSIEAMTPGQYKTGAKGKTIQYDFTDTPFGLALLASTEKGLCYLGFFDDQTTGLSQLQDMLPGANFRNKRDNFHDQALTFFTRKPQTHSLKLHLQGTPFQLKVWQALIQIPDGSVTTYSELARSIRQPTASRAVGNAVGSNPISFIIPCHRVIRSTGVIGHYHWGTTRKKAMLGWEAAAQAS